MESNSNNSNGTSASPGTSLHEEIVAYLDGELTPEECERVEARLSSDDSYRRELQEMDRAWHALEQLPQATVSDDFARTTIEMVTVAAELDLTEQTMALPQLRRKRTLLLTAICATAATVGFAATQLFVPDANRVLVNDLPVIQQLDTLTQIDSVEYLRELRAVVNSRWWQDHQEEITPEVEQFQAISSEPAEERQRRVEQLELAEQSELQIRLERFLAMNPAAQDRLRELNHSIVAADDADELQQALVAYGHWLASKTPGERAELLELPLDERRRRIQQMHARESRSNRHRLPEDDERALAKEILEIVEEQKSKFREQLPPRSKHLSPEEVERMLTRRAMGELDVGDG